MEERDYSWDDQNPEEMQSWHEFEGQEMTSPDFENFPTTTGAVADDFDSPLFSPAEIQWLENWMSSFLSQREVDTLMKFPTTERALESHPDIQWLMLDYKCDFETLRQKYSRLRAKVQNRLGDSSSE